jgi:hypothetical protein
MLGLYTDYHSKIARTPCGVCIFGAEYVGHSKDLAMSFFQKLRRLTNNRFPSKVHVSVMHGRCGPCADT